MNTSLFKEPKFFQLEFIKNTIKMIDAGCKFRIVHYPTLDIVLISRKDEGTVVNPCAMFHIFNNG